MALLRWQWRLANGGSVAAVIDTVANTETVSQGDRVLSSSPRGGTPDGHIVAIVADRNPGASERPPIEATVTFATGTPVCILRIDGHEVSPVAWPMRERETRALPSTSRPYGTYLLIALVSVFLVALGLVVRSLRHDPESRTEAFEARHRLTNGLLVAHFPADLEPRTPGLPGDVGGLVLEDRAKTSTVVLSAVAIEGTRDPWVVMKRLHDDVVATLPRGMGKYEETARHEGTCVGRPGAIVAGKIVEAGATRARVWTCAFVKDDAGYLAATMVVEPASAAEERRLHSVVEATELTHLSDLGKQPPPR